MIVKLRVPAETKRSHAFGRKCRAEYVDVLDVIGADVGISQHESKTEYRPGQRVTPDLFDENWRYECSSGIHFFITREEAEGTKELHMQACLVTTAENNHLARLEAKEMVLDAASAQLSAQVICAMFGNPLKRRLTFQSKKSSGVPLRCSRTTSRASLAIPALPSSSALCWPCRAIREPFSRVRWR